MLEFCTILGSGWRALSHYSFGYTNQPSFAQVMCMKSLFLFFLEDFCFILVLEVTYAYWEKEIHQMPENVQRKAKTSYDLVI